MKRWRITKEGIQKLLEHPEGLDEDDKKILQYLLDSNETIQRDHERDLRVKALLEE